MKRLLGFVAVALAINAWAQDYPAKPVRLIVGFPPGGGGDLMARISAEQLTKKLGGSFVVVNMPGASATIAAAAVAKAPPDGYTLLHTTSPFTLSASLFKSIPYDPVADFTPIARVADGPYCVVVQSASPFNSLRDVIAHAKAKPGELNYGSGGSGSVSYLGVELLKSMAGIDIQHVPFTGLPAALSNVMGGQVHMSLPDLPSAVAQVKAGRLKMLAVTSAKRVPSLPEVPTVAESGLPGYEVLLWYGVLGPAGLPAAIRDKLQTALTEIYTRPEPAVVERLSALGVVATPAHSSQQFAAFIKSDLRFWEKLVDATGTPKQ
ncbi:MAG TPA: tripartite tricarboxylate transporter substrate-binding protein [Burkholderiales bacterium]|nr:tripartite tricarboxylate transporter substrate-binding protein [Burkholderiales bacterium]